MPPHARKVVIHYHLFKNAGTSIERSLRELFGDNLHQLESDSPSGHVSHVDANNYIVANPSLVALTSHQLRPPLPDGPFAVFPIVVLREPISRVRSAYLFEWQKQLGLDKPKGTLAEYVQSKLGPADPTVIADFQVGHLSRDLLPPGVSVASEAAVDTVVEFVDSLPAFGLVERFDESVQVIGRRMAEFFGDPALTLSSRHDNVMQDQAMSIDDVHDLIRLELGPQLMDELLERNQFDLAAYQRCVEKFDDQLIDAAPPSDHADHQTREVIDVSASSTAANPAKAEARLRRRVKWQNSLLANIHHVQQRERDYVVDLQQELSDLHSELDETRRHLYLLRCQPLLGDRSSSDGSEHLDPRTLVGQSGFFDPAFYLANNPDVASAEVDPLTHFVANGGVEGRSPSPLFDTGCYLRLYPDVRNAGINPLVHYLLHGRDEGRAAVEQPDSGDETAPPPEIEIPRGQECRELCQTLAFESYVEVDASIVIPIYNEVEYTVSCLESLRQLQTTYRFEVIVMDDCSTDPDVKMLAEIPGLRYVRNDENLGFLRNCNRSADVARGRYLVLLNNDTRVEADWLDKLLATFDQYDNVGLVGSKLVYPDGRLQEAGGVIFRDGSGWNYGRGEDPDHPNYNYVRDVDYCSAASVAIERTYFEQLGRFDEQFAPAYYEDTDLCFKVRHDGRRVLYQPASVAVHFEGVSSGTDLQTGVKQHQVTNAKKFQAKWQNILEADHHTGRLELPEAVDRQPLGHVLIIDANVPAPDRDAGSVNMFNIVKIIQRLGYRTHFVPAHGFHYHVDQTRALEQLGCVVARSPYYTSVEQYLEEHADRFDVVVVSRVTVATAVIDAVLRMCPSAKTVFYTVDLHHLRARRQAELSGSRKDRQIADEIEAAELDMVDKVDVTVVLSEYERTLLNGLGKFRVSHIPLVCDPASASAPTARDRDGAIFVGGFAHPPNVDAVRWLISEIWPAVRRQRASNGLEPLTLRILGSGMPKELRPQADDIECYGFVENLKPIFDRSLVAVAPLRFGAGMKGKVLTSMGFGLPVVATPVALEGMPPSTATILADPDPEAFATAVVEAATFGDEWQQRSELARQYVDDNFSVDALTPLIAELLGDQTNVEDNSSPGPKLANVR